MDKTWTVWIVTDVYPPRCGGSGWSTRALARTLLDRGHRVEVVVVDPAGTEVTTRVHENIPVTAVGVRAARTLRRRLGARDYAHAVLADYLRERLVADRDVDLLHGQHLYSTSPVVVAGREQGRATVATVRDYWPVCLHGTAWWGATGCPGCTPANLRGCMAEYWRWPSPVGWLMEGWARRRLAARASDLSAADKVLTVSAAVRRRIEQHLPHASIAVVPNIVDPDDLQAQAVPWSGARERSYLLAAGKLQPTKGFDLMLEMLAHVGCGVRLVVAGDGPLRSALEARAIGLGVEADFLGWVDHDRLLGMQRDALAVILPSAWEEPLSRVVLETMALGTPVVAWARGGNPEIIESGVNGYLVDSTSDLSAALDALQSGERAGVGAAARSHVRRCYAPDAVYPAVAAVYTEAIAKSGR